MLSRYRKKVRYAAVMSDAIEHVCCSKPLSADWKADIDKDFKNRK
jgi:hypothetical protein